MKPIYIYCYIITLSIASAYGQLEIPHVINASGGAEKAKGYILQWSIGELTLINEMDAPDSSYILTNGFIQPTGTLVAGPVQPTPILPNNIQLNYASIQLFPNPTHDIVEIQSSRGIAGKVSLLLYNEVGGIVYQHEILLHGSTLFERINLKGFPNGVYILHIKKTNPITGGYNYQAGTFKIIKM